jgi:hypothetical protein
VIQPDLRGDGGELPGRVEGRPSTPDCPDDRRAPIPVILRSAETVRGGSMGEESSDRSASVAIETGPRRRSKHGPPRAFDEACGCAVSELTSITPLASSG